MKRAMRAGSIVRAPGEILRRLRPLELDLRARNTRYQRVRLLRRLLPVTVAFLAVAMYSKFQGARAPVPAEPTPARAERLQARPVESESRGSPFSCDGRTYCSQMTSCAEATYFLEHCANVKMDGDHDGVPCESQWCPNG
jgi:hypothetical protein